MSSDPLSDILAFANASSAITGGWTCGGQWSLRFPKPTKLKFFAFVRGGAWVIVDGREPLRVEVGDVVSLSTAAFVITNDLSSTAIPTNRVFTAGANAIVELEPFVEAMLVRPARSKAMKSRRAGTAVIDPGAVESGIDPGAESFVLGGHVDLDPSSGGLLAEVLPSLIHVRAASPQASAVRWLVAELVRERQSKLPGSTVASNQLAQLMFVQLMRVHLASAAMQAPGLLRALSDRRIAPALHLMHDAPGRAWKLGELARASAMSRTTFALHFKAIAGVPPLAYLTQWRMRLAERELREGKRTVSELSRTLGYSSESAFSNAFKRLNGMAPKRYRTAARRSVEAVT